MSQIMRQVSKYATDILVLVFFFILLAHRHIIKGFLP